MYFLRRKAFLTYEEKRGQRKKGVSSRSVTYTKRSGLAMKLTETGVYYNARTARMPSPAFNLTG